jgi:tetratricopeptide (TPR) repeat protein
MNSNERARIEALAEKLNKRGKYQDAIHEYQRLLSGTEQDIPIRTQIGDLYVRSNQKRKAVEEFFKISEFYERQGLHSKAIATLNRIVRLDPDYLDSIRKLAQLYKDQGFTSEARSELARLAAALAKQGKIEDAILVYRKLLKLSPNDMDSRTILANLLKKTGEIDSAMEEFNLVAEFLIQKNRLTDAHQILTEAQKLKEDYPRTLTNLIELFKLENNRKEALDLVKSLLAKDKDNIKALYLLGNLYFEDDNFEQAEEIFKKIVSLRSKEVQARVKLGRILIQRAELDQAFEMFEPLIDTLMRKQMDDKAIGLLGLILTSKQAHLPTLEKLAELYKSKSQKKNLETVYTVLIEQYRKQGLMKKVLALLKELVKMFPDNQTYYSDYRFLKGELGEPEEELETERASVRVDESNEIIESTIAKVDLYIEQGLLKNARRIMDNLMMRFPEDKRVIQKIEEITQASAKSKTDDIAQKIGKVHQKETELFDQFSGTTLEGTRSFRGDLLDGHLTAADIFAETDLIPIDKPELSAEEKYFDLTALISDELEAIQAVSNVQLRGDTSSVEKVLTDIVSDFRKALDNKVAKDDYESHFNLGIAFMEQELYDEAIAECKLAANSEKLAIDSLTMIGQCFFYKKEFKEAVLWLEKSMNLAEKDSPQYFAITYEMAGLYEALDDRRQACKLYEDVQKWDAGYREVAAKLKSLSQTP